MKLRHWLAPVALVCAAVVLAPPSVVARDFISSPLRALPFDSDPEVPNEAYGGPQTPVTAVVVDEPRQLLTRSELYAIYHRRLVLILSSLRWGGLVR